MLRYAFNTYQMTLSVSLHMCLQLLEMAGMQKLVPSPQRTNSGGSRYGQYTPAALSNGSPPANGPPPVRRVSADRAQVTGSQPGGPSPMAQPVR